MFSSHNKMQHMRRILFGVAIVLLAVIAPGCGDSGDQIDYVALGASDATGVGAVAPFKGYVFEIEDGLDVTEGCNGADLKNLGIPGGKVGDIQNVASTVGSELNPDLVTLWTGANDIVSGDGIAQFEENLKKILDEMTDDTQAMIFVANVPDLTQLPRFRDDPDPDVTIENVRAFNDVIARQTASHGAVLIDLFNALSFDETLVSDDGFHPSNEGHQRIAQLFLDQIIPRLCVHSNEDDSEANDD